MGCLIMTIALASTQSHASGDQPKLAVTCLVCLKPYPNSIGFNLHYQCSTCQDDRCSQCLKEYGKACNIMRLMLARLPVRQCLYSYGDAFAKMLACFRKPRQ